MPGEEHPYWLELEFKLLKIAEKKEQILDEPF